MDAPNNQNINVGLSYENEYEGVQWNEARDKFVVMPSLKAPYFEESKRSPIDIVCCIDRSGSMEGPKIELVKDVLAFIVAQLSQKDRLSLVTYDDKVATALEFTTMNPDGKKVALNAVKNIRTGGSTDLCGGLMRAVDLVQTRQIKNDVTSVLLLTDGLANAGVQKPAEIIDVLANGLKKDTGHTFSIHNFGFGSDHDAALLKSISDKASGMYFFIQNKDEVPNAFTNCLGGLLSVVGQNVSLHIEASENVQILNIKTTYKTTCENNSYTVQFGDIQSEEERDILVEVSLKALPEEPQPQTAPLLKVTLSYFNVISSKQEFVTSFASINRAPGTYTASVKVDQQKNRLLAATALIEAKVQGDKHDYTKGRKILDDTIAILSGSISKDDEFVKSLIEDLKKAKAGMVDTQSYSSYGSSSLTAYASAHGQQRSNTTTPSYTTSSRVTLQARYSDS